jgi:hypothetical protein
MRTATSFESQVLRDGNYKVSFLDDAGRQITSVILNETCINNLPKLAEWKVAVTAVLKTFQGVVGDSTMAEMLADAKDEEVASYNPAL